MKELYLLWVLKHKKIIIAIIVIITIFGYIIQSVLDVLNYKLFFTIIFTAYICIYTWFNGLLAESFPINELSTKYEVISRWLMIFTGTLVHLYMLIAPIFEK